MIELIIFIFGACIGSFLNVCIYRLPVRESIIYPGSRCPGCKTPIPWHANIPIISYILLKGRCRACHIRISPRYPIIEALTGTVALGLYHCFGISPDMGGYFVFSAVLITVSFIDLDHQIIPDRISIPGILIFSLSFTVLEQMTWQKTIAGILLGGGVLYAVALAYYILRGRQGMGGGDIKLLAMIGAVVGPKGVIFTIFTGSLLGTLGGIAAMAAGRRENPPGQIKIPFGPFLSMGALAYIFFGDTLITWYLVWLSGT